MLREVTGSMQIWLFRTMMFIELAVVPFAASVFDRFPAVAVVVKVPHEEAAGCRESAFGTDCEVCEAQRCSICERGTGGRGC